MPDGKRYVVNESCPKCAAESRITVVVDETEVRTRIAISCHRGHVHTGDAPREGPRTEQNLLQDVRRLIRSGNLKYVGNKADLIESAPPPQHHGDDVS